jgi:ABC-2 type transport system permease protein
MSTNAAMDPMNRMGPMNASTTASARTTAQQRIKALGRAELTLLWRNRTAMFIALALPLAMVGALQPTFAQLDLRGSGLTTGSLAMTGGVGFVMIFVVYYNLVTAYVARREELVLKRLRTGEATDLEILTGTALPAAAMAFGQLVVLSAAGALLPHAGLPHRPDLLVLGVVLGTVTMAGLAAVTTSFTRSVELAQLTTTPVILVLALGSGLLVPLDQLPASLRLPCRVLPMSPVMDLVQAGWVGGAAAGSGRVLTSLALAAVWTSVAILAGRRWFRWEPRR